MTKQLMSYDKFKHIMNVLIDFQQRKDRISNFFEKELMEDSWCILTLGSTVEDALVNLLADEFECWYSFNKDNQDFTWWAEKRPYGIENDIENWLYSIYEEKSITINGKEIDISSIESFYDFLVSQYKEKHNLTDSNF